MSRIALILLLFILLAEPPFSASEPPLPKIGLSLDMEPQALAPGLSQRGYGPLRLDNVWRLRSANTAFGGISSLLVEDDGRFLALSDSGDLFTFRIGRHRAPASVESIPRFAAERLRPPADWDSESMTRDPVTGRTWVGFEKLQRICRYAPDFARIEACVSPPEMKAWPSGGSIESLVRFSDGRFLAIAEMATNAQGMNDALLWAGDPTEPSTPPPVHLSYKAPTGYRPTDALWLGGDRLLVLNRRLTLWDGFTARLVLVTLPRLKAGAVLQGARVADFVAPGPRDNLEALALQRTSGDPMLYVASDDNHFFLEKTLLYKFSLPSDWVSDGPAP